MFVLYDSRTRRLPPVGGGRGDELRIYVCGPSVDRRAHLGDLRGYLLPDLIRRAAEVGGWQVRACQPIRDVQPREGDLGTVTIARQYEDAFHADLAALNIRPAEHSPRVSESVPVIIEMIRRLVESGNAYATADGCVLFDAGSYLGYGELSGTWQGDPRSTKVALWAGAISGQAWDAPWGTGFPRWDAECAAMSVHYLGEQIDVSTGGAHLRAGHHEAERAQANVVAGHEVVSHWAHTERVMFDPGQMPRPGAAADAAHPAAADAGQPPGSAPTLTDVIRRGLDPLALRLALLEHHYRTPVHLTWDLIESAGKTLRRWREDVHAWAREPSAPMSRPHVKAALTAFADDLDTPAALRELHRLETDASAAPGAKFETFAYLDRLLGLDIARDVGKPAPGTLVPRP